MAYQLEPAPRRTRTPAPAPTKARSRPRTHAPSPHEALLASVNPPGLYTNRSEATSTRLGEEAGWSPGELDKLRSGFAAAFAALNDTIAILSGARTGDAGVIAFFLGREHATRRDELVGYLQGSRENLYRLQLDTERMPAPEGDAQASNVVATYSHQFDRYTFYAKFFADAVTEGLSSTSHRALILIHESLHELFKPGQPQTDFSFGHGVIGVLPMLRGQDPLRNPESIAATVVALGLGEGAALMRQAAPPRADTDGLSGREAEVWRTVVAVAHLAFERELPNFSSTSPVTGAWVRAALRRGLDAGMVAVQTLDDPRMPREAFRPDIDHMIVQAELPLFRALSPLWAETRDSLLAAPASAPPDRAALRAAAAELATDGQVGEETLRPLVAAYIARTLTRRAGRGIAGVPGLRIDRPAPFLRLIVDEWIGDPGYGLFSER